MQACMPVVSSRFALMRQLKHRTQQWDTMKWMPKLGAIITKVRRLHFDIR